MMTVFLSTVSTSGLTPVGSCLYLTTPASTESGPDRVGSRQVENTSLSQYAPDSFHGLPAERYIVWGIFDKHSRGTPTSSPSRQGGHSGPFATLPNATIPRKARNRWLRKSNQQLSGASSAPAVVGRHRKQGCRDARRSIAQRHRASAELKNRHGYNHGMRSGSVQEVGSPHEAGPGKKALGDCRPLQARWLGSYAGIHDVRLLAAPD